MKDRIARRRASALIAAAALALGLTACSNGDSSDTGSSASAAGATVSVALQEFAVSAQPTSVPAGSVTFDVTNNGPDDTHEMVIIKTDLAPTDLPTDKDGAVEEEAEGLTPIDEIEDVEVGASASLTVDLEAGAYVLICNILQEEPDGSLEAHYSEGMRTGFTVT